MPPLHDADDAIRLMAEAHARLGEYLHLVETEPACWYALFDGGGTYRIEWSEAWGRLVLSAELGRPSAAGERAALKLALSYNALWRELGSLRMARDGVDGELLLIGELGSRDTDPQAFDAALLHFEGLRRWWGHALAHAGDDSPKPPWPSGTAAGTFGIDGFC